MHQHKLVWTVIAVGMLLISACGPRSTPIPTKDGNTIMTEVAVTVQAEQTRASALTPSPTATYTATVTPLPVTPSATVQAVTATPRPTQTTTRIPDAANLTGQSVVDNTKFTPGAPFTVTFTLQNVGNTTWTTGYAIKFFGGSRMEAPDSVSLPKEVKPNESVEVTVSFKAPAVVGSHRSNWVLQNANGINFYPFWIDIEVTSAVPTTATATQPAATATEPVPTETSTTAPPM